MMTPRFMKRAPLVMTCAEQDRTVPVRAFARIRPSCLDECFASARKHLTLGTRMCILCLRMSSSSSCLACMTTCPSGVHYMHLVDHARQHIEKTRPRPLADKVLRAVLAAILPHPELFRLALAAAQPKSAC